MSFDVAILGEAWEAAYARPTATAIAPFLPEDARVLVPASFERFVVDVLPRAPHVVEVPGGFQSYGAIRGCLRPRPGRGLLILAAGVLPDPAHPPEPVARAQRERLVEWVCAEPIVEPVLPVFLAPPHRPPARPQHRHETLGRLDVWQVDTGTQYFQGLAMVAGPPLWHQYGQGRPIFAVNTNRFEPFDPGPRDDYFILASGLLGLRIVAESRPPEGARVVVYDINRDQLAWIRFVLEQADAIPTLDELVLAFRRASPGATVRATLPHEQDNAERQASWYATHRGAVASIGRRLRWELVECDLLTNPAPVLEQIVPPRSLFFMFLDLFVVWHVEEPHPWIECHEGMAASLRAVVTARASGPVCFLPGPGERGVELAPTSPFRLEGSS